VKNTIRNLLKSAAIAAVLAITWTLIIIFLKVVVQLEMPKVPADPTLVDWLIGSTVGFIIFWIFVEGIRRRIS
jgi:hypothetical protein